MISFECDYLEGCHEEILKALQRTNLQQEPGYGADSFSSSAREKIRKACQCPEADIWFLNGGTQTNQLVIDTVLESYEGVIAAETGHVNVHEAGAIEFSGHKVLTLPSHEGKISAGDVDTFVQSFLSDGTCSHMVFPGMVYISHPTEYGTLYTARELRELAEICHRNHMALYLDGARLGYGLQARDTDVTLPLIGELCDVFYIGGTKAGALCGEALVFPKNNAPSHFLTRIKQHGALCAKGRLIGLQFDTLFTDGLYTSLGRHGIEMAEQLKEIFRNAGYAFYLDSPTNQQFPILENCQLEKLARQVKFEIWGPFDKTHSITRFATSWATTPEALAQLENALKSL
ncbi:MAG: beta-eliminating lyase-related protein [Clostridiales bacterium]|nr:beta-eliminating lyase-related protein [Clostridiales bacterium]